MATREEQRAAREAKLAELHEKLTGAVEQLVTGEDWVRALSFAAKFRTRSFNNVMLIWAQHQMAFEQGLVPQPAPSHVAGYRQWQQLGRQVMKGQPGYMIFAPVTARFATTNRSDPSSWRRLAPGEKRKAGEVELTKMVGARPAYVWDVSQTDGDPIPTFPEPVLLEGQAPLGLWDGLAEQVRAAGFTLSKVGQDPVLGNADGATDYATRRVLVRIDDAEANEVATLAHELAHVLLHGPDNEEARQHRGISEVEAESTALMIAAAHGMDTTPYTVPYVSGWASSVRDADPVDVVKQTGERVLKTAKGILDQLTTTQIGDGDPPGFNREAVKSDAPRPGATSAARSSPAPTAHTTDPMSVGRGL